MRSSHSCFRVIFSCISAFFISTIFSTTAYAGGESCPNPVIIDFNDLEPRTAVDDEYSSLGITITTSNPNGANIATIFDSEKPVGEFHTADRDIGTPNVLYGGPGYNFDHPQGHAPTNDTPQGHILVASRLPDADGDNYVDTPAGEKWENGGARVITFTFSGNVRMLETVILDQEEQGAIKGYNGATLVFNDGISGIGNNSAETLGENYDHIEVTRIDFELGGSGGLGKFIYCPENLPPTCTGFSGTEVIEVGETFCTNFTGSDESGDDLTVTYNGLPPGSTVDPSHGTTEAPPVDVEFCWTPGPQDSGSSYSPQVIFTDTDNQKAICPFNVEVPRNKPPICNAGQGYLNVPCTGETVEVQLDGSGSYDGDGDELTYLWSTDCPGGSFDDNTIVNPILTLNPENPDGTPVSCQVFLSVGDGIDSSDCESVITVEGCTRDCLGEIGGDAEYDICGECDGDGTSCLDCLGIPFGPHTPDEEGNCCLPDEIDECGICNGNDDCKDCLGVPNGTATTDTESQCCEPGDLDECGICFGNSDTCLGCESSDITETLFELDGTAKDQEKIINHILSRARKIMKKSGTLTKKRKAQIKAMNEQAFILQDINWRLSWRIPQIINNCANTILCVEFDNTIYTDEYRIHSKELLQLTKRARKFFRKVSGYPKGSKERKRLARNLYKQGKKLYDLSIELADSVPTTTQTCL